MFDALMKLDRETSLNSILVLALILFPILAHFTGQTYHVNLATQIVLYSLAGVGLNLALGHGGMISLGHAAFFGVGGYVAGILSFHAFEGSSINFLGLGIPGSTSLPVIWIVAIAISGLLALVIGSLSIKTTGAYFIMITLAFAQMMYYLAISIPTYGGEDGLPIVIRNELPYFDSSNSFTFYVVSLVFLLCALSIVHRINGSRFGSALHVARMSEERLESVGIPVFPVKLTAFVISGMLTGLAGALFADLNGYVGPSMLAWQKSGEILIIVILGGIGRLFGPVLGATVLILLETWLGEFTEHWQFFLGLLLLCVVLYSPGGLAGLISGKSKSD